MSTRRQAGDWVRLTPGAGMCGDSGRLRAQIVAELDPSPCFVCDDEMCTEWATLWTEPDPDAGGTRHTLCHVSECEMFDDKADDCWQADCVTVGR